MTINDLNFGAIVLVVMLTTHSTGQRGLEAIAARRNPLFACVSWDLRCNPLMKAFQKSHVYARDRLKSYIDYIVTICNNMAICMHNISQIIKMRFVRLSTVHHPIPFGKLHETSSGLSWPGAASKAWAHQPEQGASVFQHTKLVGGFNPFEKSAGPSALPEGEAQGKREAWTACQLVPERLLPASFSDSTASLASPCMVPDRPRLAS